MVPITSPIALSTATLLGALAIWKPQTSCKGTSATIVVLFAISLAKIRDLDFLGVDMYLVRCFHIIYLAHIINVLEITQPHLRATDSISFLRACRVLQNPRWLTIPTKRSRVTTSEYFSFCTRKLINIICCHALMELLEQISPKADIRWGDIHPSKEQMVRRLYQVTARELYIRLTLTVYASPVKQLQLVLWHNILALFFVATRLEDPNEWLVPLYGNPSEAYTLRRYWSIFEHRLAYHSYKAIVASVLDAVEFPKRSYARRFVSNGLVFTFSGVIHGMVARQSSHCEPWLDTYYYCMSFVAIVVEELVAFGMGNLLPKCPGARVRKACGYLWVFCFHFWISAKITFPGWRCGAAYEV